MKKLIIISLLLPLFSFSQNQMINKKMDMEIKNKYQSNSFQIMKKVENRIINKWEEYSRAFEYSDFDKIKTYFTYPVTVSLFGDPLIIDNEKDLINFYKQIRTDIQDGYKYSMLEKSKVIWISKEICMLDATYSRFNENYERIYTGRGIYMYKRIDDSWKMFSMSTVKINTNKK